MLSNLRRALTAALLVLSAALVANSLLGPFGAGVIRYRFGETMTNQGIGLDAVALLVVVPVALVSAWSVHRERMLGPVLAFVPGVFAAYAAPQYVIGPDYAGLPGNNERFLLLHLGLFMVGMAVCLLAWQHVDRLRLRPDTRTSDRRRAWLLVGAAAFVLSRWLPVLPSFVAGTPTAPGFVDNPTAFLLVAVLDLGIVVPGTLTAALGLWGGAVWGRTAAYAAIGFHAVVAVSVAAMSISMLVNADPTRSLPGAVLFSFVAVVAVAVAVVLYLPARGEKVLVVPNWWVEEHSA